MEILAHGLTFTVFDGRGACMIALRVAGRARLYCVVRVANKPTTGITYPDVRVGWQERADEKRGDMARFKAEMVDGATRHLDAQRLVTDDLVRMERRNGDSWIDVVLDPSEVAIVSRRHTELNGSGSWVRVYPRSRPLHDRTVPVWEHSW